MSEQQVDTLRAETAELIKIEGAHLFCRMFVRPTAEKHGLFL